MSELLQRAAERVQDSMDKILANFKEGAKITVLVRTLGKPTADFCMTSDDLNEVIALVRRRKGEAPPETNPEPVAWLRHGEKVQVQNVPFGAMWISDKEDPRAFPVYTAPPQNHLESRAGSPGSGQPLGSYREPAQQASQDELVPPSSQMTFVDINAVIALVKDSGEDAQPDSEYRRACDDLVEALSEQAIAPQTHIRVPELAGFELAGVEDQLADGSGAWCSCTGCHETAEGVPTGPWSDTLKAYLGGGCRECGGIGAVWDNTDYSHINEPAPETIALASLRDELEVAADRLDKISLDPFLGRERRTGIAEWSREARAALAAAAPEADQP